MRICKAVQICCCCCCCARRRSKSRQAQQKEKALDVEIQEAAMELESEPEEAEAELAEEVETEEAGAEEVEPAAQLAEDVPINETRQPRREVQFEDIQDSCEFESGSEHLEEDEDYDDEDYDEDSEEADRKSLRGPDDDSEFMLSKFRKQITKAILKEIPLGGHDPDIILIGYTSHFVAGTDYYLKIFERVSGKYFHVRVYESLQGDLMLQRLSAPKQFEDPICYF